jgi:hypothetical protein
MEAPSAHDTASLMVDLDALSSLDELLCNEHLPEEDNYNKADEYDEMSEEADASEDASSSSEKEPPLTTKIVASTDSDYDYSDEYLEYNDYAKVVIFNIQI